MKYDVYLGDTTLYGVTKCSQDGDRKITVFNGLGLGNFPSPDDKDLRSWTIECELTQFKEHFHNDSWKSAEALFKAFDAMMESKEEVRLVAKSEYDKISELVLLESYTKKESFAGVFTVSLKVTEYVAAGIRSTDIPYIPRPGKVPVPPAPVKIPSGKTAYDVAKTFGSGSGQFYNKSYPLSSGTGQYYNQVYVPSAGGPISAALAQELQIPRIDTGAPGGGEIGNNPLRPWVSDFTNGVKNVVSSIANSYSEYQKNHPGNVRDGRDTIVPW